MKKWLRNIAAKVVKAVLETYQPKVNEIENDKLKLALNFVLHYAINCLEVLCDANPADREQLEIVGREVIRRSPIQALEIAQLIIEDVVKDAQLEAIALAALEAVKDEIESLQHENATKRTINFVKP